jgi:hypothetical protein
VSDHPLFKLTRLAELARTLPPSIVEYNAGKIPVSLPDWENTPTPASPRKRGVSRGGSDGVSAGKAPDCLQLLNEVLTRSSRPSRSRRACASARARSSSPRPGR